MYYILKKYKSFCQLQTSKNVNIPNKNAITESQSMSIYLFLGSPPQNVVKWIKNNYMKKVPLHFTANEDNSSVSLVCFDGGIGDFIDSWCKLDYSIDGKSWNTYIDQDSADETLHRGKVINLNKDETVYFRATLGNVQENPNLNGFFDSYTYMYH